MDERFAKTQRLASTQFGAVSGQQLDQFGVNTAVRSRWVSTGWLERLGPRSFAIVGSAPSWQRAAWAASADVDGMGYLAGRTAARLGGLDGFVDDEIEVLVARKHRNAKTPHRVCSTKLELGIGDTMTRNGIRCLTVERLILDAPLFDFTRHEIENAIDSAIRLKLVSEQRLRSKVISRHRRSINGGRILLDALVDAGGESRLERWFLALVRRAGLPRPQLQAVWRDGSRIVARIDAFFAPDLVVELAGHGTHSSRRDRQRDEQRRTELTLAGNRVITFTHDDVRDRPNWVAEKLAKAVAVHAAAA